jgi:predicted outer membrane repeat protein
MRIHHRFLLLTTLSFIDGVAQSSPPAICTAPFTADKRATTETVGTGTAASCTEKALADAVAKGGIIRFNCGSESATIALSSEITLRTDVDTTIDGANKITIDGRGSTRLFYYSSPNFQATTTLVTIQNITLQNGAAHAVNAACSSETYLEGGGGAIYMRDGKLHVWNVVFKNNEGASQGSDVAGGAIYVLGSLGSTVVGSTFESNHASNGGAIGALFGDLSIYNSVFTSNKASGNGVTKVCTGSGGGGGGSGGAVMIDGSENYGVNVCGSTFTSNAAGAGDVFGGAIFRTPDGARQTTTIDRSSFVNNAAPQGGALYFHNSDLVIEASTLSGNVASTNGGALFADGSILDFTNDTFAANTSEKGLGGAIYLSGNGGTLQNLTFVGNQSSGGSGYFAAAIGGFTALDITNSIFSENTTRDCGSPMTCSAGKSYGQHDLQWPTTHAICSNTDLACTPNTVFKNPALGALQNNGGPTKTAAPLPGSPALGAGMNCPAADQRGVARPASGCTAGAVQGDEP